MKKLLSMVLSILMVLSTFSCLAGVVYAAENEWLYNGAAADMTEDMPFSLPDTTVGTAIQMDKGYRNILTGKDYELRCHHTDGTQCSSIWIDKKYGIANNYLDNVDVTPGGLATYPEVEFVFDLGAEITPEYFAFINRPEVNLQTAEFEVYVADTYEEATANPQFLINYTRPNDTTTNHHVNIFKFPEPPDKFSYLIVRLKADNLGPYDGYRFNEIMLLGDDPTVNAGEWVHTGSTATMPDTLPIEQGSLAVGSAVPLKEGYTSILPGKTYKFACHHDDETSCSSIWSQNADKMANGVITDIDVAQPSHLRERYPEIDIIFNLEDSVIPEYFLFINRADVQRQIIEFDLLGANSYEEATTNPTLIATYSRYDDTTSDHRVIAYKFEDNAPAYSYLIVRLKKDTFGNATGYRFNQIMLTGKVAQSEDPNVIGGWVHNGSVADMSGELPMHISGATMSDTITFDEGYGNLLIGKAMDVSCYKADGTKCSKVYGEETWHLTANGLMDNVDYHPTSIDQFNQVDLIFDMEGVVNPEYFVLINRPTIDQQTNKYEILGANSYAEARNNPTKIAEYVRSPQDNTTDQQVNVYKFPQEAASFKYFIFRLLDDNYEGANAGYRFREVMLLGDYTPDAQKSNVKFFEENLASVIDFDTSLTAEKVTICRNEEEGKATASSVQNLQDGDLGTETFISSPQFAKYDSSTNTAIWYTDGTITAEIVYDLGAKYDISNILVTHHKGIHWRASDYEIYASKERETLFDKESLVAKVINDGAAQHQVINPTSDSSYRYVALKYINPVSTTDIDKVKAGNIYPRILEFRVYGTPADCGGNHNVIWFEEIKPGIFDDGQKEHYGCSECELIFSDSEGQQVVNPEDYAIPATGYPYHESYEEGQNFKLQHLMDFNGAQGAAIYGDTLFSLNQVGRCAVYDIPTQKHLGSFNLATYNEGYDNEGNADSRYANHSNAATFSTVKFDESDPYPLLYITTGSSNDRDTDNSMISKLAVERILYSEEKGWYSELVQLIQFNDYDYLLEEEGNPEKNTGCTNGHYLKNNWNGESFKYISGEGYDASKGYETGLSGWFNAFLDFDPTGKTQGKAYMLKERFAQDPNNLAKYKENYEGFESYEKDNAVIISELTLPSVPTSKDDPNYGKTITLTPADITDQIILSHVDGVTQAGVVYQGILYFIRGNRSKDYPYYMNRMEAIDLTAGKRVGEYKLYESECWEYEPEGLGIWNGELFMTMGTKGFVFDYVTLDKEGEEHICSLCGKNMGKHTVNFYDKMGNLIHSAEVSDSETLSADVLKSAIDSIPNIFGYNKGVNGNYWNADTSVPITEDTSFTAVYTRAEIAATLTVEDGGNIETFNYSFDEKVTITAKNEADFLGWKDSTTGAVVSKSPTYSFYMYGNVFFTAVYKTEEITSLEKDISILNVPTHYDLGETHFDVTLTASSFVPAGATVTDKGIILTNKTGYAECGGEVTLDIKTKQIAKSKRIADGNYMITVTGVKNGQVRYARAYVTYVLDGETYTVYSRNTEKISNE